MGYGNNGQTFDGLRGGNRERLLDFKNHKGEYAHTDKDGSDWLPSQWSNAMCGEAGELANLIKKLDRGDFSLDEQCPDRPGGVTWRDRIAEEAADVICYADLVCNRLGIDLGRAVQSKFNAVSERVGSKVYLGSDGDWHLRED